MLKITGSQLQLAMIILMVSFLGVSGARGQCDGFVLPGLGIPGVNGMVNATASWDPDGPGPAGPVLVIAGSFSLGGRQVVQDLAVWDGQAWGPLGGSAAGGHLSGVNALIVYNGQLWAAGSFLLPASGGGSSGAVARWSGTVWEPMGGITSGTAWSLTLWNGQLLATGTLHVPGTAGTVVVARWDGAGWLSMNANMLPGGVVYATTVHNSGLIIGGNFNLNTTPVMGMAARWNGSSWDPMGTPRGESHSMASFQGLVISAGYNYNGPVLDQWDGNSWQTFAGGISGWSGPAVNSLLTYDNKLIVAGAFTRAGAPAPGNGVDCNAIAAYDGASWSALGAGIGYSSDPIKSLCVHNGQLVAAGQFLYGSGVPGFNVTAWDGSQWRGFGEGFNNYISSLAVYRGEVYAGGWFFGIGSDRADGVARLDGSTWRPTDAFGVWRPNFIWSSKVYVLVVFQDRLVAMGSFDSAGGQPANGIAAWNGGGWSPLAGGLTDPTYIPFIYSGTVHNDELIAGGFFSVAGGLPAHNIAAWNGSSWRALGPGLPQQVNAMQSFHGDLVVGQQNTPLVRWDGAAYNAMPNAPSGVTGLAVYGDELIAGGSFSTIAGQPSKGLARWNGTTWVAFPALDLSTGSAVTVSALVVAEGELVVAGNFDRAGGVVVGPLAAWNGTSWRALGSGPNSTVYSMAELGGVLHLGGAFTACGGQLSCYHARWVEDGRPAIIRMPQSAVASTGESRTLSVDVANDAGATYQWRRDSQPISDGPSPTGSVISGSATSRLTIAGIAPADAASYDCTVTNACGATASLAVVLAVHSSCGSADFNHDGDTGTDADIDAFFACLGGNCCLTCGSADFNGDRDIGTDADIDSFFRVLAGGSC